MLLPEIQDYLDRVKAGERLCGVGAIPCAKDAVFSVTQQGRTPDGEIHHTDFSYCREHGEQVIEHNVNVVSSERL